MTEQYFNFRDLSVTTLQNNYEEIKTKITNTLDQIVALQDPRTFDNTIRPFLNVTCDLEAKINAFGYALNFYPNKDIRDKGSELDGELKKFFIDVGQRKDYYGACLEYEKTTYPVEKDNLTYEENRCFTQTMRDFRREGLHLDDPEFVEMKKTLSDLATAFMKNLNEENTSFEYTKEQLNGLPESFFTEARKVADNTYKVTLKYPDYIPVSKYCINEQVRKEMYLAFNNRCAKENTPIFEQTVQLRHKVARKLGYKTHADYKTEVKIVKNAQTALDFLNNLNNLVSPLYDQEMKDLLAFAKSYEKNPLTKAKLDLWDFGFYMRAYEEEKYQIDQEEIKKYFPIDTVRTGLFTIYQQLFGLVFEEVVTDNKWHVDVQLFSVKDAESGELLGYFFIDMFPREGKYGHAAAFDFLAGCALSDGNRRPNIVTIACNFDQGGCITFNDVVTFFHEFGHCIHYICGRPELNKFSSFGVPYDAVEMYSQCLEYFCYCDEPLALLSKHVDSGEHLPSSLVKKIKDSKYALTGYFHKRQLVFGLFDLTVHMMNLDNESVDACKLWDDVEELVLGVRPDVSVSKVASFSHLMGSYDASYYGYLRAATYAAHMFKKFKDANVMSTKVGMDYRIKMLQPGSTKDCMDILTDFLGEEPNDIHYLMDIGLQVE